LGVVVVLAEHGEGLACAGDAVGEDCRVDAAEEVVGEWTNGLLEYLLVVALLPEDGIQLEERLPVILVPHCQRLVVQNRSGLLAAEVVCLLLAERSHSGVDLEGVHLSVIMIYIYIFGFILELIIDKRVGISYEGTSLWVGSKVIDLFFKLKDLFPQRVVLLRIGHVLLTCPHQLLVLFDEEVVVLLEHLDLLLVVVLHLDAHVLATVQHVLILPVHLHLHLGILNPSL
jgi:hypothetical protein